MTKEQIKHMTDRFLAWRLPETFTPDCGISFKARFNEGTAHPGKHQPTGTNLFDATQAEAMVRHMLDGLPDAPEADGEALCIACGEPLKPGDLFFPDADGGAVHASCIGPEREAYTRDGEPLKDGDPIPEPYVWTDQ